MVERARWDSLPSRVEESTRRLLDLFDRTQSRATFFVLGWVAERHGKLVREIADRGHEIACHGYAHDLVYDLGPARFRADLRRAKAAVEDATGIRMEGYRAPSYSITRASLWAIPILIEEGFRFDSSIFPIRHHRYGIPDFDRTPVTLEVEGGRIQEFPLTTLRIGNFNFPLAGGAYLRFLPPSIFRLGFGRLVRAGQPTVLYLHPWEIDPDQPRQRVGWAVRVNHYHNLHRVEDRLRALLERHRFAPMGEVLDGLAAADELPVKALATGPPLH